jgi:glycosyltransferase involved in cell wall biosynthesis
MKITIVIPVYNEAAHLGACLEAIAAQAVPAHQVIVVDNNSTDATAAIARRYPFVTLLSEPRQGVVHARNRGFDTASGDIIGRIDADTLLPPEWTAQIQAIFQNPSISAVSGAPHYYDFALSGVADAIDLYLRAGLARSLKDTNFLWGANMAVRRADWQRVRPQLCDHRSLHEDFDLGIHLQALGLKVAYDENLLAGVSSRRIDSSFGSYIRYTMASPRTYAAHNLRSRFHMYPVLMVCWAGYLPGRLIYRGYNQETGTFSVSQLLTATASRVDPSTHVA